MTVDKTYKLVHQGFPVLVFATTDRQKKFHLFGVALSSNETADDFLFVFESLKEISSILIPNFVYSPTTIIADGAAAITNGFQDAFDQI